MQNNRDEKLQSVIDELVCSMDMDEGGLVDYSFAQEFLDNGKINHRYLMDQYLGIKIAPSKIDKFLKNKVGTLRFQAKEPSPKVPFVSREQFLEHYVPAKYYNQRYWVFFWRMKGYQLDRQQCFEYILSTAKERQYKTGAPMLPVF